VKALTTVLPARLQREGVRMKKEGVRRNKEEEGEIRRNKKKENYPLPIAVCT